MVTQQFVMSDGENGIMGGRECLDKEHGGRKGERRGRKGGRMEREKVGNRQGEEDCS